MLRRLTHALLLIIATPFYLAVTAIAAESDFHAGTVFSDFGKVATVDADFIIPKRTEFKVLFDSVQATKPGEVNRTLNGAARFMNMHAEAGIAEKSMKLAVVFHGKASVDVTRQYFYNSKFKSPDSSEVVNANAAVIKALTDKGVRVILCGQSAAYHSIENDDVLPGVEIALSAMTAHAVLQQQGYTLNPF